MHRDDQRNADALVFTLDRHDHDATKVREHRKYLKMFLSIFLSSIRTYQTQEDDIVINTVIENVFQESIRLQTHGSQR